MLDFSRRLVATIGETIPLLVVSGLKKLFQRSALRNGSEVVESGTSSKEGSSNRNTYVRDGTLTLCGH